jgi:hypothetical protein
MHLLTRPALLLELTLNHHQCIVLFLEGLQLSLGKPSLRLFERFVPRSN